jgi:hypothetical protein
MRCRLLHPTDLAEPVTLIRPPMSMKVGTASSGISDSADTRQPVDLFYLRVHDPELCERDLPLPVAWQRADRKTVDDRLRRPVVDFLERSRSLKLEDETVLKLMICTMLAECHAFAKRGLDLNPASAFGCITPLG